MNVFEIGEQLVELCAEGKNLDAIKTLYSQDIVSVEPMAMPNMPAEMKGIDAIMGKNKWWFENHTVHSCEVDGPYANGDRFSVFYRYDVTNKEMKKRFDMEEIALYTTSNGKIVKEEFFYNPEM